MDKKLIQQLHEIDWVKPKVVKRADSIIRKSISPCCERSYLVFINGHYNEALSCKAVLQKIDVFPLDQAMKRFGSFIKNSIKNEKNHYSLLNIEKSEGGIFISVPSNLDVEVPIQIINVISTPGQNALILPRIHIFMGAHSKLSLISKLIISPDEECWFNTFLDLHLEEAAELVYVKEHSEQSKSWVFENEKATLKKNSKLKAVDFVLGGKVSRRDFKVSLVGEESKVGLYGGWSLNNREYIYNNILVEHLAPFCYSSQLFKGVLGGNSRSSFEGEIYVDSKAQGTDAYQLNNNLLISEDATAKSSPRLRICAEDVKVSHGSTTGQLDEEQLFYLTSRGVPYIEAKKMLIQGFLKEVRREHV